jgi:hypothetical protein
LKDGILVEHWTLFRMERPHNSPRAGIRYLATYSRSKHERRLEAWHFSQRLSGRAARFRQRALREKPLRRRSTPARVAERCRLVPQSAQGFENKQIAEQIQVTPGLLPVCAAFGPLRPPQPPTQTVSSPSFPCPRALTDGSGTATCL